MRTSEIVCACVLGPGGRYAGVWAGDRLCIATEDALAPPRQPGTWLIGPTHDGTILLAALPQEIADQLEALGDGGCLPDELRAELLEIGAIQPARWQL